MACRLSQSGIEEEFVLDFFHSPLHDLEDLIGGFVAGFVTEFGEPGFKLRLRLHLLLFEFCYPSAYLRVVRERRSIRG